jgi:hypothetical protein
MQNYDAFDCNIGNPVSQNMSKQHSTCSEASVANSIKSFPNRYLQTKTKKSGKFGLTFAEFSNPSVVKRV